MLNLRALPKKSGTKSGVGEVNSFVGRVLPAAVAYHMYLGTSCTTFGKNDRREQLTSTYETCESVALSSRGIRAFHVAQGICTDTLVVLTRSTHKSLTKSVLVQLVLVRPWYALGAINGQNWARSHALPKLEPISKIVKVVRVVFNFFTIQL